MEMSAIFGEQPDVHMVINAGILTYQHIKELIKNHGKKINSFMILFDKYTLVQKY
jgi:hypothetical protein